VSLPQGTVTFLFTDIEGSTDLARQFGAGFGRVRSEHR
jgi:class 3 adenylate cyclase